MVFFLCRRNQQENQTMNDLPKYKFPSIYLLSDYREERFEEPEDELNRKMDLIRELAAARKIKIRDIRWVVGPSVTLFKIFPESGVKCSRIRITEMAEELPFYLNIVGVRCITLEQCMGIEIPNEKRSVVPLRSLLLSHNFRESKAELPIAIGYTQTQIPKVIDLARAPHILVAGATKQGKSVWMNTVIASLLFSKSPSEVKFVFIDPKMVEFEMYKKLSHHYLAVLLNPSGKEEETIDIAKSQMDSAHVLESLCFEMDKRYGFMSGSKVTNIRDYNELVESRQKLPYIVCFIDEFSDLTMSFGAGAKAKSYAGRIYTAIIRLAQKGRAAGIHLIIATQRLTRSAITDLIKINFPTRVAFRTTSRANSLTILDRPGAENLTGKGDLIYQDGSGQELRLQGGYISDEEVNAITIHIEEQIGDGKSYSSLYYLPPIAQNEHEKILENCHFSAG